jgi:hypothetical protein
MKTARVRRGRAVYDQFKGELGQAAAARLRFATRRGHG